MDEIKINVNEIYIDKHGHYFKIIELYNEHVIYQSKSHIEHEFEFGGVPIRYDLLQAYIKKGAVKLITKECQHEIKLYQGFLDSYHYCSKCDKKVNEVQSA